MPTNRKLGILIIVIGLLLIILIIYFGFIRKSASVTPITTPTATTTTGQLTSGPSTGTTTPGDLPRNYQQYDISKEPAHKFNADDLSKIAMAFAERLGSYSSQSDYGNFTDLKIFMTSSMQAWADKTVAEYKAKSANNTAYYGIVTTAVTTEVKSFDDAAGTAKIIVTTERRESTANSAVGTGGGQPYKQKIDFSFVKVNGDWLIDSAYWEK